MQHVSYKKKKGVFSSAIMVSENKKHWTVLCILTSSGTLSMSSGELHKKPFYEKKKLKIGFKIFKLLRHQYNLKSDL